jgi:RHS repeat-associated protein
VKVIDGLAHPLTSTYDAANRLIMTQDALGNTTRYAYDGLGNRVVMTDANGVITRYGYDALNRLIAVTESVTSTVGLDPAKYNLVTRYGYDALSNRIAVTDALTHTTVYTYDLLSRLIMMQDARGSITRYQYDAVGNRTKVIDANNQAITYTYDAIDRNTKIDYGTSVVTLEYDKVGNRTAMTDSLGVTRYVYDELNRLKQATDPFTGTVQYRYDAVGNRTQTIYPDGKGVTTTFDAANRLTGTLSWDGQLTTYQFDKAGRLVTTTLPNGMMTIAVYDDANRLTRLTHRRGAVILGDHEYTLDAMGNRLAVREYVAGLTRVVYLPVIVKDFDGSGGQMMLPGGETSPFVSPVPLPEPFASPLPPPETSSSTSASQLPDLSFLILTPTVIAAVVARRKGRKWALPIAVFAGTIMIAGLTQSSGAMPAPMPFLSPQSPPPGCIYPTAPEGTRVISYTYDGLYRLNAAAYSTGECYQYSYDRVGNRTAMTTTVGTTTYQYDPANRLTSAGGVTYTWDNNGNLLNDGTALYRYDQANRLISTTLSSTTSLFNYNGDGVRLKQVVAGAVTTYTQDLAVPLPVVLQAKAGSATTQYLYALGTRPLAENAGSWEYLVPDALGSVRQIADASGNIILTQDYEPYGSVLNSSGGGKSTYGFTGEERDPSGLLFLRARYMQPRLGIFLSRDMWAGNYRQPFTLQGYAYVQANPINLADPSGQCPICGQTPPPKRYCEGHEQRSGLSQSAPPFGYCPDGTPAWGSVFRDVIKLESSQFGVPWQVVEGVLQSERQFDTELQDEIENLTYSIAPELANVYSELIGDPGTGIGNVHIATAKSISRYFKDYYWLCKTMQLGIPQEAQPSTIVKKLLNNNFAVKAIAAYVRQLADYRFGSNGRPLIQNHTILAEWMIADAVAIWHGYRYGVPRVSPGGQGFLSLEDFQNRGYSLDELVNNVVQGRGNPSDSARRSIPIFEALFKIPD